MTRAFSFVVDARRSSSAYEQSVSAAARGAVAAHISEDVSPLVTQKMSRFHMNSGASRTSNGQGHPAIAVSRPNGHIHGSSATTPVIRGSICASITAAAPPNECPTHATRERSILPRNGERSSNESSTVFSSACAKSSARHRACSCRNRHQFRGSLSFGMSYPRKSAVLPSGYKTKAASCGWSTATTMWPQLAISCNSAEFCSFTPVKECEKSTTGNPELPVSSSSAPSSSSASAPYFSRRVRARGGSATGASSMASIFTRRK